jgi:pre-mRNA branch site protein p14
MAFDTGRRDQARLPPEVNRFLFVRNLPYKISAQDMYEIFGKYGPIRQLRMGTKPDTRGTAYVVYDNIYDAKNACDHLSGFNVGGRYLVVIYYQPVKVCVSLFCLCLIIQAFAKLDLKKQRESIEKMKEKFGVGSIE